MLKNKKIRIAMAGALALCALGSTVMAKQMSETAEIFYNNIKIYIDGAEIVPKDANGNPTEAFIMNGTTYLPIRAVSNAFGQEVEWDGATHSVYIGKRDHTKPDNYLDKIQYNDYKEGNGVNDFAIINGTIEDYNNNTYTSGLIFYKYSGNAVNEDKDNAQITISYPLNSQYEILKGKIVLPKNYNLNTWGKDDARTGATDVWFYGDNKLLYKATNVTSSMPFKFDIDTEGVNQLTIKVRTDGRHVALTDLALYK